MKNTTSRIDFAKIVLELSTHKEEIQGKIQAGKTNLTLMAQQRKVATSVMKAAFEAVGIKPQHGGSNGSGPPALTRNILTVLARIAKELNINHDEIKDYLD